MPHDGALDPRVPAVVILKALALVLRVTEAHGTEACIADNPPRDAAGEDLDLLPPACRLRESTRGWGRPMPRPTPPIVPLAGTLTPIPTSTPTPPAH
jgi:hypothetical protein